nr:T9SS type A sorting domain-containing protein [Flavobacterium sp. ASV13]
MKIKLLLFFLIFIITKSNAQKEIYDLSPGFIVDFTKFNDKIYFQVYKKDTGKELWLSDGTSGNTSILSRDLNPGNDNSMLSNGLKLGSTILNGELYFIAKDQNSKGEIWKTNGTNEGTVKVTNFLNGRVSKLTTVGTYIFFLIKEENSVLEVWKTDGTTSGTMLVTNIPSTVNTPSFEGKCNNTFIFTSQTSGTSDSKVWRSDGTDTGTYAITENIDGNGSGRTGTSELTQYIEHNNKLYFVSRYFLFETDGTLMNTKIIGNVWNAQNDLVSYSDIIEVNNNLYLMFFSAKNYHLSVWKFDNTNKSVTAIYDNNSTQYFSPSNFVKIDNSLVFTASNQSQGTSLLSLNLNNNMVTETKELLPLAEMYNPFIFMDDYDRFKIIKINNEEYLISSPVDENVTIENWISNVASHSIEKISVLDDVWGFIAYNDNLYYSKDTKLWKYANNLSTPSIENNSSLMFYPNPSTNFVNIQSENNDQLENIQIFDLNGRLVKNISDFKDNKIDVSKLNQGSYVLKAKLNGKAIAKKIIKR